MKISLLLKREPFQEIFIKSFTIFLKSYFSNDFRIKWHKNTFKNRKNCSGQIWYCNSLINSIFVKEAKSEIFDSIIAEYSYNPLKPWKSFFQKLYFNFAINDFFVPLLADSFIEISPPIENEKTKLILGGNTKLRMIDASSKNVYVILKYGFSKKYLNREIFARRTFPFLAIPKISQLNLKENWYCEEYVSGKSPDRIESKKGKEILEGVYKQYIMVIKQTKKKSKPWRLS